MSRAGLILLLAALAAAQDTGAPATVTVSMVAVQATNEGRSEKYFGPGLEEVYRAVIGLDYDTFHRVKSGEAPAPFDQETQFFINDRYTLYVTPLEKGSDGRIRIRTRIAMATRDGTGQPVNALDTTLVMVPGRHLNLGGLRLDEGELIVVLTVTDP